MVSGKAVGLGIGALIATEATGITNLSGGGGQPIIVAPGSGGGSGGGSPVPIPVPSGGSGGGGSAPTEALAGLASGLSNTTQNVGEVAGQQAAMAGQIASLQERLKTLRDRQKSASDIRDIVEGSRDNFEIPTPGGNDDGPGGGGPSITERQKLALDQGRDPFGLQATQGGTVGGIAETLRAAGETGTDVVDSVGRPGRDPEDGTFFGFINDAGRTTGTAFDEATNWQRDEREKIADQFDKASEWSNKAADTLNPLKKGFF